MLGQATKPSFSSDSRDQLHVKFQRILGCILSRKQRGTSSEGPKIKMQWYEGSVHEAIAESQRRGVMFVVYIEGTF